MRSWFYTMSGSPTPRPWITPRPWHIQNWVVQMAGWNMWAQLNLSEWWADGHLHVAQFPSIHPPARLVAVPNLGGLAAQLWGRGELGCVSGKPVCMHMQPLRKQQASGKACSSTCRNNRSAWAPLTWPYSDMPWPGNGLWPVGWRPLLYVVLQK